MVSGGNRTDNRHIVRAIQQIPETRKGRNLIPQINRPPHMDNPHETVRKWQAELLEAAKPEKINILSSFFKTGKGEYGEGDRFAGITVPLNRRISRTYHAAPTDVFTQMLAHEVHEFRLGALLALVARFEKCKDTDRRAQIAQYYLANTARINNWDLVDLSAPQIIGQHCLETGNDNLLRELVHDSDLWRRRIGIVATYTYIKNRQTALTAELAEILLNDREPLIHKASGWMLREAGKRNPEELTAFLDKHASAMPRTMLRYAIEKLDPETRRHYMQRK